MNTNTTIALAFSVLLLAACGGPQLTPREEFATKAPVAGETVLAPGDTIEIKFRYWPELSDTQTIRPDGKIALHLIGEVETAGLTPQRT